MSTNTIGLFLRHLALSEEVGRLGAADDRELLAAYESERMEAAFTELMRRYGPMVLRTCRRVLGHGADAEDAFQATFVLLARKAGPLRREAAGRLSLGGWLHRVAYQTALNVLTQLGRRKTREREAGAVTHPDPNPVTDATWNEVRPILDAELNALPDKARQLLIACYLQDKTHAEAAAELGLPLGSLARRLEKARALLAERLVRRGITLSAAGLAVLLGQQLACKACGAGVPAVLLVHTVEAAVTFTEHVNGAISGNVARLVKSGLANMAKGSTYLSVAVAGWVGLLAAGLLACQTMSARPDKMPDGERAAARAAEPPRPEEKPVVTDRFGDPLPPQALVRLGTVRLRQATGVHSLAFSHDGMGLITAGQGEPARHWDLATGRLLRQFGESRDEQVYAASLSPDGRTLAGRVSSGGLCLWEATTGTLLHRLKAEALGTAANVPLTFSPDSKTVASTDGGVLRLWETATGEELWAGNMGRDGQQGVAALTYSANGKTLIWAGHPVGNLHLWDVTTGKELRCWDEEKKRSLSAFALAPDGRLFAAYGSRTGEADGLARLWNAATGKEVWQRVDEEARNVTTAAFSPDGKLLATGSYHGPLCLWDAATGKALRRCAGGLSTRTLAFSPDGKTLASGGGGGIGGSQDQTVHLWDVGTGREVHPPYLSSLPTGRTGRDGEGHPSTIGSVAFTQDGKDLISSSWEGSVRVWDAATGEQRRRVAPAGDEHFVGGTSVSITSVVSTDGKTLVSATWERIEPKSSIKVRRWDRDSGRELHGWSHEFEKWPHALVISPDGKTVAFATDQVYLWEAATGKELSRLKGGYPAFSPDGKLLVTAPVGGKEDAPRSFTLWEADTGKELCSVSLPEGHVHGLLFSPDGWMLATASSTANNRTGSRNQPNAIHLWPLLRDESPTSGVRVGPPLLLAAGIPSLLGTGVTQPWFGAWAFSPDSRTLALSGEGGSVRLLETATGKERGRFAGHGGDVLALSFSPDGRRLASGSRDTTILVWDVTGRLQKGQLRSAQPSAKEMEKLWGDLAADDAGRAGDALWTLAAAPTQAVPYAKERLRTASEDANKALAKVAQLLRDLDDDEFAVREKAKAELAWLGPDAEPALRQARKKTSSAEVRKSLDELLTTVEARRKYPAGEQLRGLRAVEVLEQIGNRDARQLLKDLSSAAPGSSLTRQAQAALEYLERAEHR